MNYSRYLLNIILFLLLFSCSLYLIYLNQGSVPIMIDEIWEGSLVGISIFGSIWLTDIIYYIKNKNKEGYK